MLAFGKTRIINAKQAPWPQPHLDDGVALNPDNWLYGSGTLFPGVDGSANIVKDPSRQAFHEAEEGLNDGSSGDLAVGNADDAV